MSRAAQKRRKKKQAGLLQQQNDRSHPLEAVTHKRKSQDDPTENRIKVKTSKTKTTQSSSIAQSFIAVNESTNIPELLLRAQSEDINYTELATELTSFIVSSDRSSLQEFYAQYWGRSAHHSQRNGQAGRFKGLFSRKSVRQLVQNHALYIGKDVEVSQHFRSEQQDDSDEADDNVSEIPLVEADSKDVWEHFERGHTVCLLSPQVYDDPTWHLLSLLEIEFESVVGCHIYLLPPNSYAKGFGRREAPADLIVLQLEGASEWRIGRAEEDSAPVTAGASAMMPDDPLLALRNNSKGNGELGQADDMKVTLQHGDTLYVPKGFAYESMSQLTASHAHSLYLVLLTNEADSYHRMLDLVVPTALQSVLEQSMAESSAGAVVEGTTNGSSGNGNGSGSGGAVTVPRSLPHKRFGFLGVANSELDEHNERDAFTAQLRGILRRVATRAEEMADAAVDQVKKQFMVDRLPIPLSPYEERYSAAGFPGAQIMPFTELRAVRPLCGCAVVEDGKVLVFHCMDNSRYFELIHLCILTLDCDLLF